MAVSFVITRADGRSNTDVLLDMVRPATPGTIFTFDDIAAKLAEGTDRTYNITAVRSIVAGAYSRMLKELQRTLSNVRTVGYRVAFAHDHSKLAIVRRERADVQMARGMKVLKDVRWNELSPEAQKAHQGTLILMSAMFEQQRALMRRQDSVEELLNKFTGGRGGGEGK